MQHELELNAWVWNAPRSARDVRRVTELAEAVGFRSEDIGADSGTVFVVRIIAVESSNGIAATTTPRTTVTMSDAEVPLDAAAFYANIATAVGRTIARTDAYPGSPTTSIQIDSTQFVVRAPSPSTALDAVLGRVSVGRADLRSTTPDLIAV
ncbi:hypothetical protein N1027_17045 [Herbiconiux sp. CPCC 205763]|uniref:Uncharacterized protein n=1 Tax=Herbiconiux aconitum TaxID=2970913 RepID=A0ABT2GY24_9MICO|nr:hypothetical protein [Herbiconiux aconitum]MCS5719839.1 hypothetical protein [Herbiconiux aconitum]